MSQGTIPAHNPHSLLLLCVFTLLALTLAMFGDVLFSSKDTVLSYPGGDIDKEFIHSRAFGFGEIRKGNLPLWNPHIYAGTPYFGGFQSALLYPPNILFLLLSVAKAINGCIALHTFLLGLFMFGWILRRGLHPLACLVSSVLLMFCGSHFLHIYGGHLSNLCAMPWAILILWSVDELLKKKSPGYFLIGVFAITMQILAGHPQYVFYTAITAGLYTALSMFQTQNRRIILILLPAMYIFAAALSAIQLLPGIDAAAQSMRAGQTTGFFASMFSFAPENLIKLFVPDFFGNYVQFPYWGRSHHWEMTFFMGVCGLLFAMHALLSTRTSSRRNIAGMVLILFLLALGTHTQLYSLVCAILPFFGWFRGYSKFLYPASIFLALLCGIGLDQLLRSQDIPGKTLIMAFSAGVLLTATALTQCWGLWPNLAAAIGSTHEYYFSSKAYSDPNFIWPAWDFASHALLRASQYCFFVCALLLLRKFSTKATYFLGILAIVEIFLFAKPYAISLDLASPTYSPVQLDDKKMPADDRVLFVDSPNRGMSNGLHNVWGFDPSLSRRYAEFLAFTQGVSPKEADQHFPPEKVHRLFAMLRCHSKEIAPEKVSPQLQWIGECEVLPGRDAIFARMASPDFDPQKTVLLEHSPDPLPVQSAAPGYAKILNASTDHLTIEAELSQPSILVVTDAYSKGWQATALSGNTQYKVIPANYILRGIPLTAGHHLFRLEYKPRAFEIGKWISLIALLFFCFLLVHYLLCLPHRT